MALTIKDNQFFTVVISAVDAKGNPAPIDGAATFAVSVPGLLAVTSVDAVTGRFDAVGPIGTVQVQASADADLGEGVVTITGLLDVEIIAGQAVALTLTPSAPQDQ